MTNDTPVIDVTFRGALGGFSLDLSCQLGGRGVTALFGPSGSGKTTVLRCIAGLNRMHGHLHVGNETWQDSERNIFLAPHRRPVGYVFQEASLFPHLSVRKNLLFGAERIGSGRGADVLRFDDVVSLLGCGTLLDRDVGALSGGERQRVAIGRALLAGPRLLLMDEPLAALDRGTKEDFLSYLDSLHNELSVPILYVSHDIAEVSRLADRIVVLSGGRNIAEGEVTSVLERLDLHPHTGRFEAGVVLDTRVVEHDNTYHLTMVEHAGHIISVPEIDAAPGDEIRLRVRARDVALGTVKPEEISIRNVLKGTVAEVRPEPDTAYAEALIDIGGAKLRSRITRASVADLALAPGKAVYALIKTVNVDRQTINRNIRTSPTAAKRIAHYPGNRL